MSKQYTADEIRETADEIGLVHDDIHEKSAEMLYLAADELEREAGAEADSEKSSEVGNAAKMREALVMVKRLFDGRLMWQPDIRKAHEAVNAALAAPPRNCDRPECATTNAAQDVWRKEDGGKTAYYEWLFAEAKGYEKMSEKAGGK